ncbi:MAG: sensor histidine kinase [Streptosporangiaceae bacterium]
MTDQEAEAIARPGPDEASAPLNSAGLRRITGPVSIAVFAVATAGLVSAGRSSSAAVLAVCAVALAVAAAGTAAVFARWAQSAAQATAALVVTGLAGALLAGLLPDTTGFVIVYLALAGLGMRLSPRPALAAGVVVLAALNAALLTGQISVPNLISQDVGAAFIFAIGAFTRSAQLSQQQARAAQLRAEDLLAQLRASQQAAQQAAALTERARLAREIHDILAHALAGLVLALDTMELLARQAAGDAAAVDGAAGNGAAGTSPASPDVAGRLLDQIVRAQRIARNGLADTRSAIAALRGDALPGPALLGSLVRDAAATGVDAELTVEGPPRAVPPEIGLALYRTAQEALTNTAKHSGAGAHAQLSLRYAPDSVELIVTDGPAGGHPAVPSGLTFGGYGLTGMRERAELLGGTLTAGPTETGFAVRLRLPVTGPEPAAGVAGLGPATAIASSAPGTGSAQAPP